MTTLLRRDPSSGHPATEVLAAHGGPRAVKTPFRERWRMKWWRDGLQITKHLRWGLTTNAIGDGVVGEFEREFARVVGCQFALAMNSGTAALHSALFAVGVGPGDEVILPSYTWHATASAILCCGGKPIFCDIDRRSLTADPQDIERRITRRTKAIMVVHVWGNPAEVDVLRDIADKHGLPLVEDCSHAHGATYRGKAVGAWGDIGCFSLQGGKAVSAGEGGVAVCNRREYYERMLALGHPIRAGAELKNGSVALGNLHLGPKYRPHLFGVVLALSALRRLPTLNALRRRNWRILCEELEGCPQITPVATLPGAERGGFLEFKLLLRPDVLRGESADFIANARVEGVPITADRYGCLHESSVFRRGGPITLDLLAPPEPSIAPVSDLPNTEAIRGWVVTLPAFTDVPERYVREVAAGLRKVARHGTADA
jgi:dTDP-4-amino-4,6-dideoxygalactose transaminase